MVNAKFKDKITQTTIKAPFGWVGGKSKLAKDIIALMPDHTSYVEVFGGALSVFYQKSPSKIENERLKDILSKSVNGSIKDADVARKLGISPNAYAGMKFRNAHRIRR